MRDKQYYIPDLLHWQGWPWKRRLSPHYSDVKAESTAWTESFKPFSERGQKAFNACDLSQYSEIHKASTSVQSAVTHAPIILDLLGSLTYSNRNKGAINLQRY